MEYNVALETQVILGYYLTRKSCKREQVYARALLVSLILYTAQVYFSDSQFVSYVRIHIIQFELIVSTPNLWPVKGVAISLLVLPGVYLFLENTICDSVPLLLFFFITSQQL